MFSRVLKLTFQCLFEPPVIQYSRLDTEHNFNKTFINCLANTACLGRGQNKWDAVICKIFDPAPNKSQDEKY